MAKTIKILEAKQRALYTIVQNLYDMTKSLSTPEFTSKFLIRIQTLDRTREDYLGVLEEINMEKLNLDPEYEPSFHQLEVFEELLCHIKYIENNLKSSADNLPTESKQKPKLPALTLVKFNGEFTRWELFYQNFKQLVHENKSLTDAERIQYLTAQLSGTAAGLISGILPVASNYNIIWKLLTDRFHDSRTLAGQYLNKILNFKPLINADSQSLDYFTEHFITAVSSLKALNIVDLADFMILHLALNKLNRDTVNLFEQQIRHESVPSFNSLAKFLMEQTRISARTQNITSPAKSVKSNRTHAFKVTSRFQTICILCNTTHALYQCDRFKALGVGERLAIVNKHALCKNCLRSHNDKECKSKYKCLTCRLRHHSLLHDERRTVKPQPPRVTDESALNSITSCLNLNAFEETQRCQVSPTAVVNLLNNNNKYEIRLLLDTGANSNIITRDVCKRLKLKIKYCSSKVYGISDLQQNIIGYTEICFESKLPTKNKYNVTCAVIEKITGFIPAVRINVGYDNEFSRIELADKAFYKPAAVDCLIGAGIIPHLLLTKRISIPRSDLVALETTLGYIIMGCSSYMGSKSHALHALTVTDNRLELTVQNFWELESVAARKIHSPEEVKCEEDFEKSVVREADGTYTVSLPFREDPICLGDSYHNARRRFHSLEKKLDANKELRTEYDNTIREYINKGFIKNVVLKPNDAPQYFIPHRAIYRPDKDTSKVRIVLDASAKTTSGKSLNDILLQGPNLQSNIFDLLLKFRLFKVAFSADIEKMFFNIKVNAEHRKFQRILYRLEGEGPVQVYEFERVPFGLTSSPYLALRIIRKLASDEGVTYPEAARVSSTFNYMDDYLLSVPTPEKALTVYKELVDMFATAGFNLTKWVSNSSQFMNSVPEKFRASNLVDLNSETETKLVGLWWNPTSDEFLFKSKNNVTLKCTKRNILSITAALFDPLGMLAPMVAKMKLLIQDCWMRQLAWDDEAPPDIALSWNQVQCELNYISKLKIPRHVGAAENLDLTLIGFADASEKCYGAVIYMRIGSLDTSATNVSFLCARSRVAPLKKISLARLELCAAHLLALLTQTVSNAINNQCKIGNVFAFSDSTITLSWITSSPHRWQTFVANRTAAIQEIIPKDNWYHISGVDNPSDIISRPVTPKKLAENETWLKGPSWLLLPKNRWLGTHFSKKQVSEKIPESKTIALVQVTNQEIHPLSELASRVSGWNKLLKVITFVLRFAKRLNSSGQIRASDLDVAETCIIRNLQSMHFAQEIKNLHKKKMCTSALRKLNPFLDNDIIKVGGRLQNSLLEYEKRHPILLPAKDKITSLLVEHFHESNCHTGPGLLLALIRERFWIPAARNLIRKTVHNCNVCFKNRPRESIPLMGNLPEFRVSQAKPFSKTGVDYAGPVLVTPTRGRGVKKRKAYICVFVCMATRAVHIELVSDLTTEMFIAAFKRFIGRRGPVSLIVSDGGRNFLGASRKFNEIYDFFTKSEFNASVLKELTPRRIEFKVNPPNSPHFGGIWETAVKSVKNHLYRVVGTQILTYEEFNTLLIQIEALLNSRPLCVLSNEPSDMEALTPAHFLNLTPLKYIPSETTADTPLNRLQRYALVDKFVQSYWRRWHLEYLTSLQVREKWNKPGVPVKIGQVVILKEQNLPTLCWPLGIIEETYPGNDGIVRVVKVRTKTGSYVRPVVRVCPLPTQ